MYALLLTAMLIAQQDCPNGRCPRYEWTPTSNPDQVSLMQGDRQIGVYRFSDSKFYPRHGNDFYGATEPPVAPPTRREPPKAAPKVEPKTDAPAEPASKPAEDAKTEKREGDAAPAMRNYGIDTEMLKQERREYICNGKECTRQEAFDALHGQLVDDSTKWFITYRGAKERCDRLSKEWDNNPVFAELKPLYHFNTYDEQNELGKVGFVPGAFYFQHPSGKVALRVDGELQPAQIAEAGMRVQRKANPQYDPAKDPKSTEFDWKEFLGKVPVGVWVIVGAAVVLVIANRRPPGVCA